MRRTEDDAKAEAEAGAGALDLAVDRLLVHRFHVLSTARSALGYH